MAKTQLKKFHSLQLLSPILIIGYLCLGFVPNLEAVDKIAPQWVGMNILNLISLSVFAYFRKSIKEKISKILTPYLSLFYVGFILWAGLSYFYAINSIEVLVNITRQVNVLLMFLSMAILFLNIKNRRFFVSWSLTIILSIEIYYVLNQIIELVQTVGSLSDRASLKGVAANPNITAFSIAIKIPFLIYLIFYSKKNLFKYLLSVVLLGGFICLSAIQSRASILAIIGIIIMSIISILINKQWDTLKKKIYFSSLIILPFFISILINQNFLANRGADIISRTSSISVSQADESIGARLRYYSHVIEHTLTNPLFGVGLGNWKLKSIEYDSKNISGYVVPYHAHSDFIQLGSELGIIGFLLYLGIFIWAVYYVFVFIVHSKSRVEEKTFVFLLLVA